MQTMENQDAPLKENEEVGSGGDVVKRKKRAAPTDSSQLVRVELSEGLAKNLNDALEVLQLRGVSKAPSDFVEEYLSSVTDEALQKWIELETPMEWRLKAALADPIKEKLIRQIFSLSSQDQGGTLSRIEKILGRADGSPKRIRKKEKIQADSDMKEGL